MLRGWLRKVVTGIAAFLLACLEALGSANLGYSMGPYVPHYTWTDYGMRVHMEQQEQAHREMTIARLEGDVQEEHLRRSVS
ncbi:hypothetical protein JJB07_15640 [Tumebacillus sp. ITR2]|jgi:hypothetical protein|uniref:Uncharacterized protein n=1 Tax=Tumebacillus amylolyticus TaxID=2801339 RepID=A0ABS1JCQ4_9BACL|nr:hypothetical protein [Tumebacillus amylolyticus]MBL0388051.1 hypothetical protein [Tumebacillus amylolyticus]